MRLRHFVIGTAIAGALAAAAFVVSSLAAALRTETPPQRALEDQAADPGFPRTLALPDGSTFLVPARPRRVVATSARAIDFVAALADAERIAGFPEQAIEYATLEPDQQAALAGVPRFDSYVAEPVLRLVPDLVVADVWQSPDTHARLAASNVPLLLLPAIVGWEDAREVLLLIGRALGEEERAAAIAADLEERVARLQRAAAARPRRTALVYSNFGAQGFTAGSSTSIDDVLRLAGLANLVAESGGEGHLGMTFEDLLRFDPDLIVVSQPLAIPAKHTGDRGGASEAILLSAPSLAALRAVRERRIIALPAGLYASNSHRIVRAAEVLAEQVDALFARIDAGSVPR